MKTPGAAGAHGLVGESPEMAGIRRLVEKASRNRLPVLLLGESGTGKEVVARAIYESARADGSCRSTAYRLVGTLMESELFGHTKGSFSGAAENKKGLVELADGGTVFFDEIGDLPLEMRPKLLRLIQEREFRPMGALQWRQADLRIVAATHRDLKAEVAAGRFRQDLYFRLNVLTIRLPPLRDRKSDIPVLVEHFLEGGRAAGLAAFSPDTRTMAAFRAYDWPGNVRELKHCIDRMSAMYSDGALQTPDMRSALQDFLAARDLDRLAAAVNSSPASDAQLPEEVIAPVSPVISLSQSKRLAIENALAATHGKRGKAARLLGIGRTTLYRKMKQYGIE